MVLFSAERQTKEVSLLEKIDGVAGHTMFDSVNLLVRHTVVIVLAGRRRGHMRPVCFVQPRGDLAGNTLVLPQGGIRLGETLESAALREICEELAIDASTLTFVEYLGSVDNPIPRERQKPLRTKRLHFVLVTTTESRLALNPASTENIDVMWAHGLPVLMGLMADVRERRPVKYEATLAAVTAARVWPNQHRELVAAAD